MGQSPDNHPRHLSAEFVLERLDKMVEAGRIAPRDEERLRAAAESGGLDDAVPKIRIKHAKARVGTAGEGGRLSQEEANIVLQRLKNGEHPATFSAVSGVGPVPPPDMDDVADNRQETAGSGQFRATWTPLPRRGHCA